MITTGADVYLDIQGLGQLKRQSNLDSGQALKEVARQFESVFVKMMLKSMRDASFGDPLFDSETSSFYRDMYDQQLSLELTKNGSLGLADVLVRQLGRFVEEKSQSIEPGAIAQAKSVTRETKSDAVAKLAPALTSDSVDPLEPTSVNKSNVSTPESFIQAFWPLAEKSARQLGTTPAVILAQAGLETGWGRYVLSTSDGQSSYNLFNIKADRRWQGETAARTVVEYQDGVAIKQQARFRAYPSYAESFQDYVNFLKQSPRYREALNNAGDPARFISELQQAGYATDPNYAEKIVNIMQREPRLQTSLQVQVSQVAKAIDG